MRRYSTGILKRGYAVFAAILFTAAICAPSAAGERALSVSLSGNARAPIGWIEFCSQHSEDCAAAPNNGRDAALTANAWKDLVRVNQWVNNNIKPMTDAEHWGVVEKWSYPDDGYGDCEDYVLLKRKMLMQAGWPRHTLLITVVREMSGDGHAVLTVKTDKGDFILDNQNEEILLWSQTSYRYVKRQSQSDPNVWVSLGDPRPAPATATSR